MAFQRLEYTKSWRNPADFPTYESDEAQVRADLQCLHDEARDGINRVVDALNEGLTAAQVAFASGGGLEAETVQEAIGTVYEAVQDAAAGQIIDGTITKEKLAPGLLERVYGGSVWVAMDAPDGSCNPEGGFPVGQQWLCPGFSLENLDGKSWSASAGTAAATEQGVTLTGDGSMAAVTAAQTLSDAGLPGDRVLVKVQITQQDPAVESVKLYLNGAEHLTDSGVPETTVADDGTVTLTLVARWPEAAQAVGSVTAAVTAVNVSAAERQASPARPLGDWAAFLETCAPFTVCTVERRGWIQTQPGVWVQTQQEILPVSMGGTGMASVTDGSLLCGSGGSLTQLAAAETAAFLQCRDGMPGWLTAEQTAALLQVPVLLQGTYTGDGSERTVQLPLEPVLLAVAKVGDGDTPAVLLQDSRVGKSFTANYNSDINGYPSYTAGAELSGGLLRFWMDASEEALSGGAAAKYLNEPGATYRWTALGMGGSV